MSYFEKTQILAADSPSIDSFGKWRVSNPTTLFDSKQVYNNNSNYFDTYTVGSASTTYNSGSASSTLSLTGTGRALRQTKRVFHYQPGKSQQIIATGIFGDGVSGVVKRIGSFDDNDGIFFEQNGSSFGVTLRKTIDGVKTDTFVSQSDWNIDKLNGTGPSGLTLDITKAQIYNYDYEWLGVGRIRYYVVLKGIPRLIHEITNYNSLNGVYMRNPNLPIRYEISGSGTSNLTQICSTVISEGGFEFSGDRVGIHDGNSTLSGSQYGVCMYVRLHPSASNVTIIPEQIDLLVSPGNNSKFSGRWDLLINPTTSDTITWNNVSGSTISQFAVIPAVGTISDVGRVIATGYFGGTGGSNYDSQITLSPFFGLGKTYTGTSDVLALAIKQLENTYVVYPTMVVRELT